MVYRLLAVNIDGTLLQSNGRLNKLTKEAIEYVHHKGVTVTLVTSRSFHSAKKVAKALKIDPMIIAHHGGYIGTASGKPVFVKRIPEKLTLEIVQLLEKTSCQISLVHEKYMLGNRVDLPENLLGKAVLHHNEQNFYSQSFVDSISGELNNHPISPTKITALFHNERDKRDIMKLIRELFPEVMLSGHNDQGLTILPKGVSKWNGILYLAEQLGVKRNEIVAIGDEYDDLEMIERSGLGVAMGNAPAEVKIAAKWVTRTNDENGVAYMLKEFFRKQHPLEFLEKMNMLK
ncbi:Cof-type HAD-IIB family hydrolase [Peribacillus sp. B-H-3]|uniref:Cof-type HAD-IIB family hydrolase n=1 Tax=Peribacillus sp. B-H-3 TaxID=3400420 RepID=UPI003B012E00